MLVDQQTSELTINTENEEGYIKAMMEKRDQILVRDQIFCKIYADRISIIHYIPCGRGI